MTYRGRLLIVRRYRRDLQSGGSTAFQEIRTIHSSTRGRRVGRSANLTCGIRRGLSGIATWKSSANRVTCSPLKSDVLRTTRFGYQKPLGERAKSVRVVVSTYAILPWTLPPSKTDISDSEREIVPLRVDPEPIDVGPLGVFRSGISDPELHGVGRAVAGLGIEEELSVAIRHIDTRMAKLLWHQMRPGHHRVVFAGDRLRGDGFQLRRIRLIIGKHLLLRIIVAIPDSLAVADGPSLENQIRFTLFPPRGD